MSFKQFLTAFKARWKLAFLVYLAIVAAAYIISVLLPPKYTASASVMVDVKSADPVAAAHIQGPLLADQIANEANVIQSERVMLRALNQLKILDDEEYRAKWADDTDGGGDFGVWLAGRLARDLDIKPAREGSMITVQFTSTRREFSSQLVNALVAAYIETTLAMRVEPAQQFTRFFDERANASRSALEIAQKRLSGYQQSRGMVVTDERLDIENARLTDLSSQLTTLQATASESSSRQRESGRRIDVSPDVLANPLIEPLATSLAQQEMRLAELQSRLTEDHPQIVDLKTSIGVTRAKIRTESQRIVSGMGVLNDVNRARVEQAAAALTAQREKVLRLKSERDEAAVLQRDVENAQRVYDASVAKLSQSDLESRSKQTNVSMLKTATTPGKPSSPRILFNVAVSLVLGALVAVAAVYLRELADRKLRSLEDVRDYLGYPLLGVLPRGKPGTGPALASSSGLSRPQGLA